MSVAQDSFGTALTGGLRVAGFLGLIVAMLPVHLACLALMPRQPYFIPRRFQWVLLRILGIRLRTHGAAARTKPTLFVANHTSYLDVQVLGSLLDAAFVAKAEVAGWPLFGFLAKLHGTLFIERNPHRIKQQAKILQDHLALRRNLILFPEGTSTDGLHVLPFKSSLFAPFIAAAATLPVTVQPVSVICAGFGRVPAGVPEPDLQGAIYAWFGTMTLLPHLWQAFKTGRYTIDVVFHAPVAAGAFASRKDLAAYCEGQVAQGLRQVLAGDSVTIAAAPRLVDSAA